VFPYKSHWPQPSYTTLGEGKNRFLNQPVWIGISWSQRRVLVKKMSQTHGYPRYDDDNEDYDEPQPEYQVQYDNEKKTRRFPVKDGKATAQYPNYDRYEGQFVGAKRNGVGKCTFI